MILESFFLVEEMHAHSVLFLHDLYVAGVREVLGQEPDLPCIVEVEGEVMSVRRERFEGITRLLPRHRDRPQRMAPARRSATRMATKRRPDGHLTTEGGGFPGERHRLLAGGRYWDRTSDLFGVNEARSRCANRPALT